MTCSMPTIGIVREQGRMPRGTLETCGADRDRTDDIRLAKAALSQLSYSPGNLASSSTIRRWVGQGRVELPTSRLSGVRSNHLSYWPIFFPGHTRFPSGEHGCRAKMGQSLIPGN